MKQVQAREANKFAQSQFLHAFLYCLCSQMLLPPQGLQRLLCIWCSKHSSWPPQSLHLLLRCWCSQSRCRHILYSLSFAADVMVGPNCTLVPLTQMLTEWATFFTLAPLYLMIAQDRWLAGLCTFFAREPLPLVRSPNTQRVAVC